MPNKEYEVGFGKPPKHSQFQPGKSGNPAGRPKKSKNLKTILLEQLTEEIQVKQNGTRKKMTTQEAIVKSTLHNALNGDRTSQFKILEMILKVIGAEVEDDSSKIDFTEDEHALIERYQQRIVASASNASKKEDA